MADNFDPKNPPKVMAYLQQVICEDKRVRLVLVNNLTRQIIAIDQELGPCSEAVWAVVSEQDNG